MTTTTHIHTAFVKDLAYMLGLPPGTSSEVCLVAVKGLQDELKAARGQMSPDTKRTLADLETLAGWIAFGTEAAREVWEGGEDAEFPDSIAGEDLENLVERQLAAASVPRSLLGPLSKARLTVFREAYGETWRAIESDRSEAAYERQCSRHYGGDGPRSLAEQAAEAQKLK